MSYFNNEVPEEAVEEAAPETGKNISELKSGLAYAESRKLKNEPSLHDQVEQYHVKLMMLDTDEGKEYYKYHTPMYLEQSIEGNLIIDDGEAAKILRSFAEKHNNTLIPEQKIGTIMKSINVVQRRYNSSRKERRNG